MAGLLLVDMPTAEPLIFELAIRSGELPGDRRVVRVRQGDDVMLRWTTDKPVTVHLHGYDVEQLSR